jgi:hypothetical protein
LALPGEFQGTESLVVGLKAKLVVVPSRDGALGVIGVNGKANLILRICIFIKYSEIDF